MIYKPNLTKDRNMPKFSEIPQITKAKYHVDIFWSYLEEWLEDHQINLNPDFQRNYVWSSKQKEQYIEWILRGGQSGNDIYFNHPGWFRGFEGEMIIVDGKQRVDAVLGFLHDEVKAYGHYFSKYKDPPRLLTCNFSVYIADLKHRKDVLKWYIDMNTGGTVHTDEEIEHVKRLLENEK